MERDRQGAQSVAQVCARCGASGDHMHGHATRVGTGARILWFCAKCLNPGDDAPGENRA